MIAEAKTYAKQAHESIGQKRKYTDSPYFNHVFEVADIVASVTSDRVVIAAAAAHDILEDVTPCNPTYCIEDIEQKFGEIVADLVWQLTDQFTKEKYPKMNREQRKRLEAQRWTDCDCDAKTIKLADILSNTKDIVANDPEFAKTYIKEKINLLPYLEGGDPTLFARARQQIEEAAQQLNIK